jgi:hypothetical protein
MAEVAPPRPLAQDDERTQFDCGRDSLNAWFRNHAWHNHVSGISRTSVICDTGTGVIAGYVTLSAAQIERQFLAKAHRRNKPIRCPQHCWDSWQSTGPISVEDTRVRFYSSH